MNEFDDTMIQRTTFKCLVSKNKCESKFHDHYYIIDWYSNSHTTMSIYLNINFHLRGTSRGIDVWKHVSMILQS